MSVRTVSPVPSRPLSRRKLLVFAAISMIAPVSLLLVGLLVADLYVHRRAERSAGLNRWGYRGPVVGTRSPGELRIAVLGGSTAFGYGLPWSEAAPAVLERHLNARSQGPRVSVVNLGFNNEGAYSYRFTLEDFAFLDYDVACLFDGYNDLMGDDGPNTALYRHDSAVFRLTGYFPILPLVLAEKAMVIRSGGNLKAAYAASRGEPEGKTVFTPTIVDRGSAAALESAAAITESLGRQLGRLSPSATPSRPMVTESGCAYPWALYCESMYVATRYALDRGKRVAVVLQPRLLGPVRPRHADQQNALIGMMTRMFAGEPRVRRLDLTSAVDLGDRDFTFDGMHLSTDGTERAVRVLVEQIVPFLAPAASSAP